MLYNLRTRLPVASLTRPTREEKPMTTFRSVLAFLGFAATVAGAQMPPPQDAMRPRIDVAELLNLDASRASQVEAILQASRAKMRSAHELIGPPTDDTTRSTLPAALGAIRSDTHQ